MKKKLYQKKALKESFINRTELIRQTIQNVFDQWETLKIKPIEDYEQLQQMFGNVRLYATNSQKAKIPVLAVGVELDIKIKLPEAITTLEQQINRLTSNVGQPNLFRWDLYDLQNGKIGFSSYWEVCLDKFTVYAATVEQLKRVQLLETVAEALNNHRSEFKADLVTLKGISFDKDTMKYKAVPVLAIDAGFNPNEWPKLD